MLWCTRTNNQKDRNTAPSHSRQQLKVFLSPQPSLKYTLDTALPTRGTRSSSSHQWAGTSPSHQEACTSVLDYPVHQRADTKSKRNYNPAACGTANIERQIETAEEYVPDEGTKIKHRRTTKWREDRQPTWKRIQSNDDKDDQRSQKKNEGIDWEDKINV